MVLLKYNYMSKKDLILIFAMIVGLIVSIAFTFYKTIYQKNFEVISNEEDVLEL